MGNISGPGHQDDTGSKNPLAGGLIFAPDWASRLRHLTSSSALLLGIVACVLVTALLVAGGGGLVAGQNERSLRATQTTAADIDLQFELGIADLETGRYDLAAQRFAWILERVPDYPGAAGRLAEARRLAGAAQAVTPTPIPPSVAGSQEERFAEARALYDNQQWEAAILRLQELQRLDPRYREVEVKQMLYDALVTLGLQYARGDRIEEGIFLLEQAAAIRPLDDQAAGERYFATLYVTGRTYWNLNWPVVIRNFEAIYEVAPYYRDVGSRLWEAYTSYGDQLVIGGAPCDAVPIYETALRLRFDSEVRDKIEEATEACLNPSPTPSPTLQDGLGADPFGTPGPDPDGTIPDVTPEPTGG